MKIQKALLSTVLLAWSTAAAAAQSNLVLTPTGAMRIQLDIPTDADVDQTTPLTKGRIEIAPILFVPDFGGRFSLNHMSLGFADVSISRRPFGAHTFRAAGVHLAGTVAFAAFELQPHVYTFAIPPEDILFHVGVWDGDTLRSGDTHPAENVTGTIDLGTDTFQARAVLLAHESILGVDIGGPLTITLTGVIGPDTDGDGVPDVKDNCPLVSNPMVPWGAAPQQPQVVSPVVTPPPTLASRTCAIQSLGTVAATDVCDATLVNVTNDAPPRYHIGTTTVTWTGAAASGRVAAAPQSVIVTDRTPPVFVSVPPPIAFSECHPVGIGLAVATDDCDFGGPTVINNAPARFPVGRTVVTWGAIDRSGNRATATQVVTVKSCGAL